MAVTSSSVTASLTFGKGDFSSAVERLLVSFRVQRKLRNCWRQLARGVRRDQSPLAPSSVRCVSIYRWASFLTLTGGSGKSVRSTKVKGGREFTTTLSRWWYPPTHQRQSRCLSLLTCAHLGTRAPQPGRGEAGVPSRPGKPPRAPRVQPGARRPEPAACTVHPAPCTVHPAPCTAASAAAPPARTAEHPPRASRCISVSDTQLRGRAGGRAPRGRGGVGGGPRVRRPGAGGKEARGRGERRRRTLCTPPRATPLTENWEAGPGGGVRRPPPWAPPRPAPPRPPRPPPAPTPPTPRPAPPARAAARLGASSAGRFFGFPFGL
ncbi:uncharacterized protein [Vulpes vulpes]|uniref:Basic proline-rich protein-like n=1 Tax=Vulpes vulpes TaxID=9627 RepID=A0ABM4YQ76_VULVU